MSSIKKLIRTIPRIPDKIYNLILLKYRHVQYGENLKIQGRLFCVSNSKNGIVIDDNVSINSCRASNPIGGETRTILFARGNAQIKIGANCGISNATIFACELITIEEQVFIGGGVKIYDSDFHWINFEKRINSVGGVTKPVIVKRGAFIGAHSLILKGVTIGERSVIGAGSVVTKNIPDGEVWAGNPAKFIKYI